MNKSARKSTVDLAALAAQLPKGKLPPVHKWNPDFCGEIDIRIARDGTWFYMGTPIGRQRMVKLFATVLRHDDDGKYYLVTPVEKLEITVDDAPFVAVEMKVHGEGPGRALVFRTNVDEEVIADATHPIEVKIDPETKEPAPYVKVRDRLWALIARSVFFDLVNLAEDGEVDGTPRFGVWSAGRFFPIGEAGWVADA